MTQEEEEGTVWRAATVVSVLIDGWFSARMLHDDEWVDWFTWQEEGVDWRRKDDGSTPGFADLEMAKETDITRGVVCTLMPDDIHGVRNDGDVPSVSLHVYGKVLATLDRSEFDPINKTQKPCPQRKRTMADA